CLLCNGLLLYQNDDLTKIDWLFNEIILLKYL
ncbi:MAG: hypothetical protein ACJAZV_001643, partial [Roseivirga sp.]